MTSSQERRRDLGFSLEHEQPLCGVLESSPGSPPDKTIAVLQEAICVRPHISVEQRRQAPRWHHARQGCTHFGKLDAHGTTEAVRMRYGSLYMSAAFQGDVGYPRSMVALHIILESL